MKILRLLVIVWSFNTINQAQALDAGPDFAITGITPTGNQVALSWTGGRGSYQVQTRNDLSAGWSNWGNPILGQSVTVPVGSGQAFFRVVSDYTAQYQVVFDASWS
jgi:hypothetical protein